VAPLMAPTDIMCGIYPLPLCVSKSYWLTPLHSSSETCACVTGACPRICGTSVWHVSWQSYYHDICHCMTDVVGFTLAQDWIDYLWPDYSLYRSVSCVLHNLLWLSSDISGRSLASCLCIVGVCILLCVITYLSLWLC